MSADVVATLIQEVTDLLPAGRVGLYEFIWILRSDDFGVPEADLRGHAQDALERMLAAGSVRLVWQLWGDVDFQEDAEGVILRDQDWDDPTEKPYLAVVSA